jgi:hypothetical protein
MLCFCTLLMKSEFDMSKPPMSAAQDSRLPDTYKHQRGQSLFVFPKGPL